MSDCVFCWDNWKNLDVVERPFAGDPLSQGRFLIINPLDPVTEGHVLVIANQHSKDAADDPQVAADCVLLAADYVRRHGLQANIITSIGPLATQTIKHTHVHVVPRREGDSLPLPWTPQHEAKALKAERDCIEQEAIWP